MDCPKCKVPNPEGKRFCGDCGSMLDVVDEEFRQKVQNLLKEHLKDQKMVEIETADAVVQRLKVFAKPFLYTLALFVAVLGFLGFRSTKDLLEALRNAQQQAVNELRKQAAGESQALAQEADAIRAQYRKLGDQQDLVAQLKQTETQLRSIQTASQGLKQRYEQLGTDLATAQTEKGSEGRTAASVPSEAGIHSGSPGRAPSESGPKVYAVGSSGPEVARIQRRLKELGCYSGEATGEYDLATRVGVSHFNEARGDVGIGIVDGTTWSSLFGTGKPARCH